MDQPKNLWVYLMTVAKRSLASWGSGDLGFGLAAYISIIFLPFFFSGAVAKLFGDLISGIMAWMAIGYLVVLVAVITPYRMWREELGKVQEFEESLAPKIKVGWRYYENKGAAQLVLTNISLTTIENLDLKFRNYRNADGSNITDAISSMRTEGGAVGPMALNPNDTQYFEFARIKQENGIQSIAVLPDLDQEAWVGTECGVKMGISGRNVVGSAILLRLKLTADGKIEIEPWNGPDHGAVFYEGAEYEPWKAPQLGRGSQVGDT